MGDIQKVTAVQNAVNSVIKGKEHVVEEVLAAIIAGLAEPFLGGALVLPDTLAVFMHIAQGQLRLCMPLCGRLLEQNPRRLLDPSCAVQTHAGRDVGVNGAGLAAERLLAKQAALGF